MMSGATSRRRVRTKVSWRDLTVWLLRDGELRPVDGNEVVASLAAWRANGFASHVLVHLRSTATGGSNRSICHAEEVDWHGYPDTL